MTNPSQNRGVKKIRQALPKCKIHPRAGLVALGICLTLAGCDMAGADRHEFLKEAPFIFKEYVLPVDQVPKADSEWFQWVRTQANGFQWSVTKRLCADSCAWSGDGRWIFAKRGSRICQIRVEDGVHTRHTEMPCPNFELVSSTAGLVVFFVDRGRTFSSAPEPVGLLLLDADTLTVKRWHPVSVIGLSMSLPNDPLAIAVRDGPPKNEDLLEENRTNKVVEDGWILVLDPGTGRITASGRLKRRVVPAFFRQATYGHGHTTMRMTLADDGRTLLTDGPGGLCRYTVQGKQVTFDQTVSVAGSDTSTGCHVDIWSYGNEYLATNRGLVKTSDPTTVVTGHTLAVAADGWILSQKDSIYRIEHPVGKTFIEFNWGQIRFDADFNPGGPSHANRSGVWFGPSSVLPSFFFHEEGGHLVVARYDSAHKRAKGP